MTNDCKTCPVSTGTHKPAEALHQKIEEPQPEAYRLADECEESATHWVHEIDTRFKAAKMLRAQQARIAELESQVQRAAEIERAAILLRVKNRAVAGALLVEDFRSIVADRGPAQQAVQAAEPEGWKLAPIKVPDSAFAWVSGGYPAGFKAGDKRDTAVVHERAQRTWEAILNGITAPAPAAVAGPDERAAFEQWLGIKPCGAAHDFGWAAWRARAALAATKPAAQDLQLDTLKLARDRLADMLEDDDGQAWKEARKAMPIIDAALAAQDKQGGENP